MVADPGPGRDQRQPTIHQPNKRANSTLSFEEVGAPAGVLMALQRQVGNRAVGQLMGQATGRLGGPVAGHRHPTSMAVQRDRDPELENRLVGLRGLNTMPYNDAGRLNAVRQNLAGVDLTDEDNLAPVVEVLTGVLHPSDLNTFLLRVDAEGRRPRSRDQPGRSPAEIIRDLNAPRRGPYGLRGPGVAFPVFAEMARPLLEPLINAMASVRGLMRGLYYGLVNSVGPDEADAFAARMLRSAVLNVVFPPVFLAGTAVGLVNQAVAAVQGIYNTIVNFNEILAATREVLASVVSPEGAEIGRVVGEELGRRFGARLVELSRAGVFEFTYEMGKMIGPAMVYVVLGFIGLPALGAGALAARIGTRLTSMLRRFPRLAALARRVRSVTRRGGADGASPEQLRILQTLRQRIRRIESARGSRRAYRDLYKYVRSKRGSPQSINDLAGDLRTLMTQYFRVSSHSGGMTGRSVSTVVESLDGRFAIRITHNQVGPNPIRHGSVTGPRIHIYNNAADAYTNQHGVHLLLNPGTSLSDVLTALRASQ